MNSVKFLNGEQVYLRALRESDIQGPYLSWLNDEEVCRGNSHHFFPFTAEEALEYLRNMRRSKEALVLAIILREGNVHIGNVALQRIDWIARSAELAILIGEKSCWGKGIAKQCLLLLMEHAFSSLNLHRIYCATFDDNIAMCKVAQALGMKEEGRRRESVWKNGGYRNTVEFGLLREETVAGRNQAATEDAAFTACNLPRYSPWPARLLGLEPWQCRVKNSATVLEEFDVEKWGALLAKAKLHDPPPTVDDVQSWELEGVAAQPCWVGTHYELLTPIKAKAKALELLRSTLMPYLPAAALVELGAGYGGVFLPLVKNDAFRRMPLYAGEFSPSGLELLRLLAETEDIRVVSGSCDFASKSITELSIPEGAVIFTFYAAHYIPELSAEFVAGLARFRPRVVVHFEPCPEHTDKSTLLGLMRFRYSQVNGYNQNLVSLLHERERAGAIQILEERRAVLGINTLLPASVIAWAPA